jgi:glucokinase
MKAKNVTYAVGIDFSKTGIKYALVDSSGTVRFEGELPSLGNVSAAVIIGQLTKATSLVVEEARRLKLTLQGIGITTAGNVDPAGRTILGSSEKGASHSNIKLADCLEEVSGLPVKVGNAANLIGLGEAKYGAGKGCTDVICLTVTTRIGGAAIIGGNLFCGYANKGAEFGHVPLLADGEQCSCGASGCLDHYASVAALVRQFRSRVEELGATFVEEINGQLIIRLYNDGFRPAVKSMEKHFYYLGRGIAGFINVFSPQRVIIGGDLADAGDFYLNGIKEVVKEQTIPACASGTKIVRAELGERAGCIGAASLLF